jgi:hypothetical protein
MKPPENGSALDGGSARGPPHPWAQNHANLAPIQKHDPSIHGTLHTDMDAINTIENQLYIYNMKYTAFWGPAMQANTI